MKDSDLGIPARPGPVANGPAPQSPSPPEQEKRGPGRPAGSVNPKPNVKPLSTERLIEFKELTEAILASAGEDQGSVDLIADIQLKMLELEKLLITRRKGNKPA